MAAVGLVWFQPQKLFIDQTVNEAAPGARTRCPNDSMPIETGASRCDDDDVARGNVHEPRARHDGKAIVKELADGSHVLRLEDFETSNGPDVRVYLSAGKDGSYGKDFVDLGGLKGNVGNQNYAIPSGTDLDRYDTAVIWCRRFTVAFGAAELSA